MKKWHKWQRKVKFRLIFYGTVLICVYRQKPLTLARIRRFPNPDRGDDEGSEGGARQDNGLRPCPEENSALQVLCPSLSPRCRVRRSVSGRTLLLSRNSSSIWASRLLSLSSHRSFVCERRPLQSTISHSLSAMLRWYLYWTDIDIMILTMYKISWRIVKYVLKVSGVFPKGRKRDNKRSSVSLFFRLSAWPVPSLRFCDLQKTLRAERWHTYLGKYSPPKNMKIFNGIFH